jgi:hypothetical protein
VLASVGAIVGVGVVVASPSLNPVLAIVLGGLSANAGSLGWNAAIRWQSRVAVRDPSDQVRRTLHRGDLREARIVAGSDAVQLAVPRPWTDGRITLRWSGVEAQAIARRLTGRLNVTDGTERQTQAAAELLAGERGDLTAWLRRTGERHSQGDPRRRSSPVLASHAARFWEGIDEPAVVLGKLGGADRLAVEMWFSEDVERTWLEGELKLLDREWREAEQLAKIADDPVLA